MEGHSNPAYGQPAQGYPVQHPQEGYATQQQQQQPMMVAQQPQMQPQYAMAPGQQQPQQYMAAAPMPMAVAPGQQPMMMVPAGYVAMPILAPDLMSAIGRLKGTMIKQKVELLEVLTNCEQKNRYHSYAWDPQLGEKKPTEGLGEELFKFKEDSDCCIRIMCGSMRPFKMALYANSNKIGTFRQGGDPLTYPDAITLERPFKCTCLCFQRPIIKIKHNTLGYIGEIANPFRILSRDFIIRPPTNDGDLLGPIAQSVAGMGEKDWYRISGTLCQPAMWCFMPCGDCAKVTFEIYAGDDYEHTKPLGYVARVWPGCLKTLATDADNYVIEFPANATPIQKACLTAVPILIDFMMFENKGNQNGGGGGGDWGGIVGDIIGAALR